MGEEKKLWQTIKSGTEKLIHWSRIENMFTPGIPDLLGSVNGKLFVVELKIPIRGYLYLRPAQLSWMRASILKGGITPWVGAKLEDGIAFYPISMDLLNRTVAKGKYLAFNISEQNVLLTGPKYNWKDWIEQI
jgi:Holliday junction resolvase